MDSENSDRKTSSSDKEKEIQYYHRHHGLKVLLGLIVVLILMGAAFAVGVATNGNFKTRGFGRVTDVQIERSGRPGMGGFGMMRGVDNGNENFAVRGQLTAINGSNLTVKDNDGTDYTVKIADSTSIIINRKIDKAANLKTNAELTVSGTSNSDGTISAASIRALQ